MWFSQFGQFSQFMFPKYLIEYRYLQIVKLKFKSEMKTTTKKVNKSKHRNNIVLKEIEKKRH